MRCHIVPLLCTLVCGLPHISPKGLDWAQHGTADSQLRCPGEDVRDGPYMEHGQPREAAVWPPNLAVSYSAANSFARPSLPDPFRPNGSLDCWPNSRHSQDRLNSSDASSDTCALDGRTTGAVGNSYPPLVLPV